MADGLTFTPTGEQPSKGLKFTKFSSDGSAAVRSVFPEAVITSGHRTNNVGFATDDHHFSHGAVDVAPIKGMTFDQFTSRLKAAGYPIIQAIDEVNHPSKYATGPHWHVALGERETGGLTFTPAQKPVKSRRSAPQPPRLSFTPQPQKSAQRPANQAAEANPGLGEAVWKGVKHAPREALDIAKSIGHGVAHPIETGESIGKAALDMAKHPVRTAEGAVKGGLDYAGGAMVSAMDALGIPGANARGKAAEAKFKASIENDPIGTALVFTPVGRIAGKLGLRGVRAAELVGKTPEERAAIRAKRVEDSAVAKRYKDVARPIMARHRIDVERATSELRKHQKTVGNLPAEEQRKLAIAADTGDRTGIAPEHHAALDAVRKVAKFYDKRIHDIYAAGGHSLHDFMDNYYTHLWKEAPGKVKEALGRQGSSRSLKSRTLPTLADGIRAGLTPKYENMLDTMTHYAHQMSAHLVNHDLMNAMRKDSVLGAKFVPEHRIPEGMSRVEGLGTTRAGKGISKEIDGQRIHTGNAPPMVLAAKDAAAKLYNRRIGKSIMDGPKGRLAKRASGLLVSAKLFSAYHPALIAGKAVGSDIGNGLRHLSRGAPVEAVKALAHMPFAPATTALQGAKMGKRILSGDEAMTEMDNLYREAGGSVQGGLTPFHSIGRPSMAESTLRGTFMSDLKNSFEKGPLGALKGVGRTALRALDTVNDLTFRYYVPAIKRGAFERELSTSLKAHPEWGDAEKLKEARNILSSIDGRMGLMTKDNLFWSNTAHDISRMIFLSPSWQVGNVRILNDAMKGVPKEQKGFFHGKGITNGRAQAAGLLGSYMLGNAILQYVYTGKPPQNVHDLMAAQTGGKNKDGSDARVTMPSVIPELYRWFSAPEEEVGNVLNPAVKTQMDLMRNRDYADHPIYRPDYASPWPHSRAHDIAEYELQGATPIPFSGQDNDRSHISQLARIAGLRPAGKSFANPEGYAAMRRHIADKESAPTVRRERQEDAKKRKRK